MAIAIWSVLLGYMALGVFALIWLFWGRLARFDEGAAHAPLRVKLMLVPGMLALWPVLLLRSFGVKPPEDREHAVNRSDKHSASREVHGS